MWRFRSVLQTLDMRAIVPLTRAVDKAIQVARQRQEPPEFTAHSALRGGMERSLSRGVQRLHLRQSHDLGFAHTHLQKLLTATAMHIVRVITWLWGEPLDERRRQPGHFAQLSPHPWSRQTVLC